MQATSMRRLLSYDMGAMFCSRLKASTLSVVATSACKQGEDLSSVCSRHYSIHCHYMEAETKVQARAMLCHGDTTPAIPSVNSVCS